MRYWYMKNFKIIALAAAFSVAITALPMLVHGDEELYNPENDPLVSLSYINEVVTPKYEEKITELNSQIASLNETVTALNTSLAQATEKITALESKLAEQPTDSALGGYEVVHLTKGSKLLADSPCEIIPINGLNNITDGTELLNAVDVPLFNCLIVPRGGDGRGIQVTSDEAYVMVRGDYQIVN